MKHSWIVVGLVALAPGHGGCGGPPRGIAPNAPENLGQTLIREVGAGQSVAIVPSPAGLRAVSADGARDKIIVPGPIRWAIVDERSGVVWYGTPEGATILAVDLRAPVVTVPATATIVAGLPVETDGGGPLVSIRHGDNELTVGHPISPHVAVVVAAEPSLIAVGGILEMWGQAEEFQAEVDKATWPGRAHLAELAKRAAAAPAPAMSTDADLVRPRVEDVDASACEEDPDACGQATAVAGTELWRVAISFSCGDGCYVGYRLYDPETKTFLDDEWATQLNDAWVAPDGSAFVTEGKVIRFDRGVIVTPTGGDDDAEVMGGGWLGGGTYYGP